MNDQTTGTDYTDREAILGVLNNFYDGDSRTQFILSLDGGGLYGLTEAIWLRQLCEAVPGFLVQGQVRIFAGCSAGAANALILASFDSPREAVLAGVLEDFWTKTGVLSNESPVTRWTKGMTAMFGAEDEYGAVVDIFGDKTLGDLPNHVLISTFNYAASTAEEQAASGAFGTPFDKARPDWTRLRPEHVFRMKKPETVAEPRAGQTRRHWHPKFFDNHALNEDDRKLRVVDVAMAAMCVPGIRPFRGGLGDGGLMSADPSIGAIAHLIKVWEACVERGLHLTAEACLKCMEKGESNTPLERKCLLERCPREQIRRILVDGERYPSGDAVHESFYRARSARWGWDVDDGRKRVPDEKLDDLEWVKARGKGILLNWCKCLSIGPGQALPAYGYSNFDIGLMTTQLLPFNPFDGNFWPQSAYSLDQPSSSSQFVCSRLLNEQRYLRLDPDVMKLPTMIAAMMSVNPILRARIIREIYRQTDSAKSRNAVRETARFLQDDPENSYGLGKVWGTAWYYDIGKDREEAKKVRAWQADRDAREAERLRRRPRNPWTAWMDAVKRSPWGAWMASLQETPNRRT